MLKLLLARLEGRPFQTSVWLRGAGVTNKVDLDIIAADEVGIAARERGAPDTAPALLYPWSSVDSISLDGPK